ncbi:MAG: Lrp/AsnC family transcriptional regulator [Gammaproteobacteria bacterium]|nr:Lrp/AsnC family transcriptional regulator [Gammaproteobacteria bacterium]
MDAKDRKILDLLQQNAMLTAAEVAEQVGLTTTPCWRRIQRLEEQGFITNRVALLDRQKMNVGITVFVSVRANRHASDWVDRFREVVRNTPEIIEAHRLSGDTDYLLRVVVPSIESFDQVYKQMITSLEFTDVSSSFSMEELKYTTAIPITYI